MVGVEISVSVLGVAGPLGHVAMGEEVVRELKRRVGSVKKLAACERRLFRPTHRGCGVYLDGVMEVSRGLALMEAGISLG